MKAKVFFNKITNSRRDFLQEFINILNENNIKFCIIGGLAVNAYVEPVVTLDIDIVILSEQIDKLMNILQQKDYSIKKEAYTINVSCPYSDLRIQIQTDENYQVFISRATKKKVLGYELPVACLEDLLQSKIFSFLDKTRRPSKRQKDLTDIIRIIEKYKKFVNFLPEEIKNEINKYGL